MLVLVMYSMFCLWFLINLKYGTTVLHPTKMQVDSQSLQHRRIFCSVYNMPCPFYAMYWYCEVSGFFYTTQFCAVTEYLCDDMQSLSFWHFAIAWLKSRWRLSCVQDIHRHLSLGCGSSTVSKRISWFLTTREYWWELDHKNKIK
jgi:hypothetical protein